MIQCPPNEQTNLPTSRKRSENDFFLQLRRTVRPRADLAGPLAEDQVVHLAGVEIVVVEVAVQPIREPSRLPVYLVAHMFLCDFVGPLQKCRELDLAVGGLEMMWQLVSMGQAAREVCFLVFG